MHSGPASLIDERPNGSNKKTGFGGESEIGSIKITRAQQFGIANPTMGRLSLWIECDDLPEGMKHFTWQPTSVGCHSGMCGAGVSRGSERMLEMRRRRTTDERWFHGAAHDCRTVLRGDFECGALGRVSTNFASQRFATRPGSGNVDSLATARPDRSPTIREES